MVDTAALIFSASRCKSFHDNNDAIQSSSTPAHFAALLSGMQAGRVPWRHHDVILWPRPLRRGGCAPPAAALQPRLSDAQTSGHSRG